LKFERIVVGTDPELRIARAKAVPELGSVFGERKVLRSIDLEGLVVTPAILTGVLWSARDSESLRIERVTGKAVKFDLGGVALPPFEIDARLNAQGGLQTLLLGNSELKLTAKIEPDGKRAKIEIEADNFPLPIGTAGASGA